MNFAPTVARLMGMKPEVIEVGLMPPGEAGILVKQILEAGYTGTFGRRCGNHPEHGWGAPQRRRHFSGSNWRRPPTLTSTG
jgi:hypothetical protein